MKTNLFIDGTWHPAADGRTAPFGGMKQSGIGREGGHDGLLEFMGNKYVAVEW
jgi:acyl-CoA reductase-like NAD-dependent aldehyde dehydrogenase